MTQHFHTYHHTKDIFHPFSKSPTTSDWHRWHMHCMLWSCDFSNVWTQTETILATKRWPHSNRGIEGEWISSKESCLCDSLFCYNLQCSYPRLKLKDDFCYHVQMSVLTENCRSWDRGQVRSCNSHKTEKDTCSKCKSLNVHHMVYCYMCMRWQDMGAFWLHCRGPIHFVSILNSGFGSVLATPCEDESH